jgi:dTDP-4-amino-4,6-dideoxygalactose transaminase
VASTPASPPRIPAEDMTRQYPRIAAEVMEALERALPRGKYTLGPELAAFEQEFARYCDAEHGIGISSGTAALHLALRACGVGPGDEVITVPNTYVATAFAISYCGAIPVFVDVDPVTLNLDPARVEEAIGPRTRAIVPVHLYGGAVDMQPLLEIARRHGLAVVEDASHAHGATLGTRKVGSFGDLACFSLYPSKVLGAYGDGGVVVTRNPELEAKLRQLRYMGQRRAKHDHELLGYQERLDEIQAAILRVKLRHLDEWIEQRRALALLYDELLPQTPLAPLPRDPRGRHVYYMYVARAPRRDALRDFLAERGIGTQVIYPRLIPDQGAYAETPYRTLHTPHARAAADEIVCLPMFPELRPDEVREVVDAVRDFYRQG